MINYRISPGIKLWAGLFLVVLFLLPSLLFAQSDRRSFDLSSDGAKHSYYLVDEFSLIMLNDSLLLENFIDPDQYLLGINDVLSIEIKGQVERVIRGLVVNPEGIIFLPGLGRIDLKGKSVTEARSHLVEIMAEKFPNSEIELTLDRPRQQQVYVHGDVDNPGRYILPHQTRLDQAIYRAMVSGGANPDRTGTFQYERSFLENRNYSLRNIRIERKDGSIIEGDLIRYFRTGNLMANPIIQDGDRITIRRLLSEAPLNSISGAVTSPIEVEFRDGDTVADMLELAGGFAYDADGERVVIHRRTSNGIERVELQADNDDFSNYALQPNERLVIPVDREKHRAQTVSIHGEVQNPGSYPIIEGESTVADVLALTDGVRESALKNGAYLIRSGASSDRVLRDGGINADALQRTSDQLVQGLEYLQLEAALNRNQIYLNLNDEAQLSKVKLFNGDRIFIPRDEQTVMVIGQVNTPGFYNVEIDESITDYISKAGGFALAAEESRIFIIKAGSRSWYKPEDTEIESGDIVFVDRVPYDELHSNRMFRNSNIQLIMTGITTLATVITTYAVYRR